MKDRIFVGPDVEEALASAAATLGLPLAQLRYVVLEAGTVGGRGLKPTPARIAILLQDAGPGPSHPARSDRPPSPRQSAGPAHETEPLDPRAEIRSVLRALTEAGGLDLEAVTEETDGALIVHLQGPDTAFLLEPGGSAEVLLAIEHLLQRTFGSRLFPLSLRVRCEGFRERRDQALTLEARQLAEGVRSDGQARTMEPLNAYERRVVHLALQEEPGVTTFSTGEGSERRVTVAPRPPAPTRSDGDER
jgi:spoIIIJ-associated protein